MNTVTTQNANARPLTMRRKKIAQVLMLSPLFGPALLILGILIDAMTPSSMQMLFGLTGLFFFAWAILGQVSYILMMVGAHMGLKDDFKVFIYVYSPIVLLALWTTFLNDDAGAARIVVPFLVMLSTLIICPLGAWVIERNFRKQFPAEQY